MDLSSGGYKLWFLPPSKQSKFSNKAIATFLDVSQVVFYQIGNKEEPKQFREVNLYRLEVKLLCLL